MKIISIWIISSFAITSFSSFDRKIMEPAISSLCLSLSLNEVMALLSKYLFFFGIFFICLELALSSIPILIPVYKCLIVHLLVTQYSTLFPMILLIFNFEFQVFRSSLFMLLQRSVLQDDLKKLDYLVIEAPQFWFEGD